MSAITLSIAVVGAVLGIINTWAGLDRTRLKMRVVPKQAIPVGSADPRLTICVEVTNLSSFAITVRETGFKLRRTKDRAAIIHPVVFDGGAWPRRLEPRSSVTVYAQPPDIHVGRLPKCAYATTDCGVTKTGTSEAFRAFVGHARSPNTQGQDG